MQDVREHECLAYTETANRVAIFDPCRNLVGPGVGTQGLFFSGIAAGVMAGMATRMVTDVVAGMASGTVSDVAVGWWL